jgi:hypothetical protein
MSDVSKEHPLMTAGLDIGDKYSHLCLIDSQSGEVMEEGRLSTTPEALRRRFVFERPMRIAIEAGTHSPWASRVLEECGHEVLVANARKLRLIYANKRKTDQVDAENLARLARLDPKLLYPLRHRSEDSQAHMAIIRSREALVSCRTQLVNHVRGAVKSFGARLPKCPARSFHKRASDRLADTVHPGLRSAAGDDLQGALSRNRSVEAGRGDRSAYGAHLRANRGGPLPLRKEPLCGSIPGACTRQRSVGRQRSSEAHLQGRRRDAQEAPGKQRPLHPRSLWLGLGPKTSRTEDSLPRSQELKETSGGGCSEEALCATASVVGYSRGIRATAQHPPLRRPKGGGLENL